MLVVKRREFITLRGGAASRIERSRIARGANGSAALFDASSVRMMISPLGPARFAAPLRALLIGTLGPTSAGLNFFLPFRSRPSGVTKVPQKRIG
jgi:hypothetical protein